MVQTNRRHTFLSASDDFDGQGARRIRTRKRSTNKLRVQEKSMENIGLGKTTSEFRIIVALRCE
jgi:hypothetical protein